MPTVLRATDSHRVTASVAFNFDDMADQAKKYLDQVRAEAGKIVEGPARGGRDPCRVPRPKAARLRWTRSIR